MKSFSKKEFGWSYTQKLYTMHPRVEGSRQGVSQDYRELFEQFVFGVFQYDEGVGSYVRRIERGVRNENNRIRR